MQIVSCSEEKNESRSQSQIFLKPCAKGNSERTTDSFQPVSWSEHLMWWQGPRKLRLCGELMVSAALIWMPLPNRQSVTFYSGAPGTHLQKERSSEKKNYNYQQQRGLGFCSLMAHPQGYQNQGAKESAWEWGVKEEQRVLKYNGIKDIKYAPPSHTRLKCYFVGNIILHRTQLTFYVNFHHSSKMLTWRKCQENARLEERGGVFLWTPSC